MQFRVPQFIDLEDKIVGPLTLKQFAYILGAGGFGFLLWTFIPIKFVAVLLILPVSGLFIALAFVKINERPFIEVLESAVNFYSGSKIYTWRQPKEEPVTPTPDPKAVAQKAQEEALVAKANSDKLHDISVGLDVLDRGHEDNV